MADRFSSPRLLCVCALQAEAQPLIAHYRLKAGGIAGASSRSRDSAFRLYSNERMAVVVSGIGKINAAAATAHALAQMPTNSIALNVGIAGSDNPLGEIFVAHCICADERNVYPPMIFNAEIPGIKVHSVDQPCMDYRHTVAFDMEASAFVAIAKRYVAAELIQSLKIISDNPDHPLTDASGVLTNRLDVNTIAALVENKMPQVTAFIDQLFAIAADLPVVGQELDDYIDRDNKLYQQIQNLHFSSTQSQQLRDILNRFKVLEVALPQSLPEKITSKASALIQHLEQMLITVYPEYSTTSNSSESNDKPVAKIRQI